MRNQGSKSWVQPMDFKPAKVTEVEISQPLPKITSLDAHGQKIYQRALILVRLHSYPLGLLDIDFITDEISPVELAVELWALFSEQINQHLIKDGLPSEHNLPKGGLTCNAPLKCLAERQELLREAPLVSIVIATRDRVDSLSTALDSLLEVNYPQFEIIVVDNASRTTETWDFITQNLDRFTQHNIKLRYVREDLPGLAVAHNRGLEEVRGSIVAFTDDDVIIDRNWLAELLHGFKAAQTVGCVTGLVIPSELQTPAQVLFEEYGGFTKGFNQQIYDLGNFRPANPLFPYAAGHFGTGANMAFKTDLLQKVGGFDPALGIGTPALGADDMAAFFQTIIHGHQLVYQPTALVYHQHRRDYEGLQRQMFGYGVGLTAFLTKCILDNPGLLLDFASKIPAGFRYAFDPASSKNLHKSDQYPRNLESIERKGMLYGPIAYIYSRWQYRKVRRSFSYEKWTEHPSLS